MQDGYRPVISRPEEDCLEHGKGEINVDINQSEDFEGHKIDEGQIKSRVDIVVK